MRSPPAPVDRRSGQAAVELLALLPALVVVALVVWQLVAVARIGIAADGAARAGARAEAVGAPVGDAARAALPAGWARDARARLDPATGAVTVRLRVPGLVPLTVTGSALIDTAPEPSR